MDTWLHSAPFGPGAFQLLCGLLGAAAFTAAVLAAAVVFGRVGHAVGAAVRWLRPLDRWLAVHVANALGLGESETWRRWTRLIASLLVLAAAAALAPAVVAWPVLAVALIALVAITRRWTWDEEDRAAAVPADHKRIRGREDYNNELLLGLSSIFLFGTLFVWRLEQAKVFHGGGRGLVSNLEYMAYEVFAALPMVGNVEALGYHNPSGVEATLPTGGWFAFGLRLALDLLVIGGVLKIVEVAVRVARGEDLRRFENAVEAGPEATRDTALLSLSDMARRGSLKAVERLQSYAVPRDGQTRLDPVRRFAVADTLFKLFDAPGGYGMAQVAVTAMQDIGEGIPDPLHRDGGVQHRLGHALSFLSESASPTKAAKLEAEAEQAFATALKALPRPRDPAVWGVRVRDLLMSRRRRAVRAGDTPRLRRILDDQRRALAVLERAGAHLTALGLAMDVAFDIEAIGYGAGDADRVAALAAARRSAEAGVAGAEREADREASALAASAWRRAALAHAAWLPGAEAEAVVNAVAPSASAEIAAPSDPRAWASAGVDLVSTAILLASIKGTAAVAGDAPNLLGFMSRLLAEPAMDEADRALALRRASQVHAVCEDLGLWRQEDAEGEGGRSGPRRRLDARAAMLNEALAIEGFARFPLEVEWARLELVLIKVGAAMIDGPEDAVVQPLLSDARRALSIAVAAGLPAREAVRVERLLSLWEYEGGAD